MNSADLLNDGFPHGTKAGYDQGCRSGGLCAGKATGQTCKQASFRYRSDRTYRRLVDGGASIEEQAMPESGVLPVTSKRTLQNPSGRLRGVKPMNAPLEAELRADFPAETAAVDDAADRIVNRQPSKTPEPLHTVPAAVEPTPAPKAGFEAFERPEGRRGPRPVPKGDRLAGKHGTSTGYQYGCRDDCPGGPDGRTCRQAYTDYRREHEAKKRAAATPQPVNGAPAAENETPGTENVPDQTQTAPEETTALAEEVASSPSTPAKGAASDPTATSPSSSSKTTSSPRSTTQPSAEVGPGTTRPDTVADVTQAPAPGPDTTTPAPNEPSHRTSSQTDGDEATALAEDAPNVAPDRTPELEETLAELRATHPPKIGPYRDEQWPGNDGPVDRDPTHGQIDRDIQFTVDEMKPASVGQRVAIERTLQDLREPKTLAVAEETPALAASKSAAQNFDWDAWNATIWGLTDRLRAVRLKNQENRDAREVRMRDSGWKLPVPDAIDRDVKQRLDDMRIKSDRVRTAGTLPYFVQLPPALTEDAAPRPAEVSQDKDQHEATAPTNPEDDPSDPWTGHPLPTPTEEPRRSPHPPTPFDAKHRHTILQHLVFPLLRHVYLEGYEARSEA